MRCASSLGEGTDWCGLAWIGMTLWHQPSLSACCMLCAKLCLLGMLRILRLMGYIGLEHSHA